MPTTNTPGLQYPDMQGMDPRLSAALRNIYDNLNYLVGKVQEIDQQLTAINAEISTMQAEIEELQNP